MRKNNYLLSVLLMAITLIACNPIGCNPYRMAQEAAETRKTRDSLMNEFNKVNARIDSLNKLIEADDSSFKKDSVIGAIRNFDSTLIEK